MRDLYPFEPLKVLSRLLTGERGLSGFKVLKERVRTLLFYPPGLRRGLRVILRRGIPTVMRLEGRYMPLRTL